MQISASIIIIIIDFNKRLLHISFTNMTFYQNVAVQ